MIIMSKTIDRVRKVPESDYPELAILLRKETLQIEGVHDIVATFLDDLRENFRVGKRKQFQGIEFQAMDSLLMVTISIELEYGFSIRERGIFIQEVLYKFIQNKYPQVSVEIHIVIENVINIRGRDE